MDGHSERAASLSDGTADAASEIAQPSENTAAFASSSTTSLPTGLNADSAASECTPVDKIPHLCALDYWRANPSEYVAVLDDALAYVSQSMRFRDAIFRAALQDNEAFIDLSVNKDAEHYPRKYLGGFIKQRFADITGAFVASQLVALSRDVHFVRSLFAIRYTNEGRVTPAIFPLASQAAWVFTSEQAKLRYHIISAIRDNDTPCHSGWRQFPRKLECRLKPLAFMSFQDMPQIRSISLEIRTDIDEGKLPPLNDHLVQLLDDVLTAGELAFLLRQFFSAADRLNIERQSIVAETLFFTHVRKSDKMSPNELSSREEAADDYVEFAKKFTNTLKYVLIKRQRFDVPVNDMMRHLPSKAYIDLSLVEPIEKRILPLIDEVYPNKKVPHDHVERIDWEFTGSYFVGVDTEMEFDMSKLASKVIHKYIRVGKSKGLLNPTMPNDMSKFVDDLMDKLQTHTPEDYSSSQTFANRLALRARSLAYMDKFPATAMEQGLLRDDEGTWLIPCREDLKLEQAQGKVTEPKRPLPSEQKSTSESIDITLDYGGESSVHKISVGFATAVDRLLWTLFRLAPEQRVPQDGIFEEGVDVIKAQVQRQKAPEADDVNSGSDSYLLNTDSAESHMSMSADTATDATLSDEAGQGSVPRQNVPDEETEPKSDFAGTASETAASSSEEEIAEVSYKVATAEAGKKVAPLCMEINPKTKGQFTLVGPYGEELNKAKFLTMCNMFYHHDKMRTLKWKDVSGLMLTLGFTTVFGKAGGSPMHFERIDFKVYLHGPHARGKNGSKKGGKDMKPWVLRSMADQMTKNGLSPWGFKRVGRGT